MPRDPKTYNTIGLRRGNPGNRGGGRTPKAFKAWCRKMLGSPSVSKAAKRILRTADAKGWAQVYKVFAAYAYGQPQAKLEVSGKLSLEQILAQSWKKSSKKSAHARKKKLPKAL